MNPRQAYRRLRRAFATLQGLERRLTLIQEALGRIEQRQLAGKGGSLREHEFRVFSQWGEDGVIQHLVSSIDTGREIFVEFGVETYTEANTRFLLVNDNWSGLVIDSDPRNIDAMRKAGLFWGYDIKGVCAFVTRENVDRLIGGAGVRGQIGLLSIDIDGMDYWVLDAISVVEPAIIVVEYNFRFGPTRAVTVPYRADFVRREAHPSGIYYGASLAALAKVASRKGYALVGCNSAGNDAFFVQRSRLTPALRELSPGEAYVAGKFHDMTDARGKLTYDSFEDELKVLETLPLVEV